jgi:hypothetical protein
MRFWHQAFVREYWLAFGMAPSATFLEAYDALCERLYFGDRGSEEAVAQVGRKGKAARGSYFFNDPDLLDPKARIDATLDAAARGLAAWRARRSKGR